MARPARTPLPLDQLRHQYCWTMAEMAALLGHTYGYLRDRLVDADGNPIKPQQIPGGGQAWCVVGGVRLPAKKDANSHVTFWAMDVEPLLAGKAFHPAGVDL